MTTPIGIHATSRQALAYKPTLAPAGPSDKHIAFALDQLAEELELNWAGSPRDQHTRDFIESIEERASEIVIAESESRPPTTKSIGVAVDACCLLMEMQSLIAEMNWFTSGASTLARLEACAERVTPIIAKLRGQQ